MLTVRRFRITIPTNNSAAVFAPRYEEPLLRLKFAAQIPQLQLPVTVDEIPQALVHPGIQWHHFDRVETEVQRLAVAYRGLVDSFGVPALQAAFPEGARFAILAEVEAAEKHLEAAAEVIEAPEELRNLGIPEHIAKLMAANGWVSAHHLAAANPEAVAALEGVRLTMARKYVAAAAKAIAVAGPGLPESPLGASSTNAPLVAAGAKPTMERGAVSQATVAEIARTRR